MQMAVQQIIRKIADLDVGSRRRPDGAIIIPRPRPGVLAVPWDDKCLCVEDSADLEEIR